jgi:hypothetical protein
MSRPLLVSDCDEVLLHMVVPFRDWLDEVHHIHFDLVHGDWGEALRHKHDGTMVERGTVWELLNGFFVTEMHRQQPIDGAIEAITRLAQVADIAILTNLMDHHNAARAEQLRAVGIDAPVHTNQGGKGEALARIIAEYKPSVTVFVDDLGHQHESVADMLPDVWRLQLVGEPILWPRVKPSHAAHARIDNWTAAESWILDRLTGAMPAPKIEKVDA